MKIFISSICIFSLFLFGCDQEKTSNQKSTPSENTQNNKQEIHKKEVLFSPGTYKVLTEESMLTIAFNKGQESEFVAQMPVARGKLFFGSENEILSGQVDLDMTGLVPLSSDKDSEFKKSYQQALAGEQYFKINDYPSATLLFEPDTFVHYDQTYKMDAKFTIKDVDSTIVPRFDFREVDGEKVLFGSTLNNRTFWGLGDDENTEVEESITIDFWLYMEKTDEAVESPESDKE